MPDQTKHYKISSLTIKIGIKTFHRVNHRVNMHVCIFVCSSDIHSQRVFVRPLIGPEIKLSVSRLLIGQPSLPSPFPPPDSPLELMNRPRVEL